MTNSLHVDCENLKRALAKIETVVTIINEGARHADNVQKMLTLQAKFLTKVNIVSASRVLLKMETFEMTNVHGEQKKRDLILFNDMLIISKNDGDKLKLLSMLPFENFAAIPCVVPPDTTKFFTLNLKNEILQIFWPSEGARNEFCGLLISATRDWQEQQERIEKAIKPMKSNSIGSRILN